MGTYYIATSDNVVNGNTFCGGSPCTAADTIIIEGEARGNLSFQNFDGNGSYITITNENTNPDERVVITTGSAGETWAGLELRDCKYVDLRGDNDPDLPYGIKVIQVPETTGKTVWARQECDHIKLGYIEMASGGLMVHDTTLSDAWTFDNFEIHHNYIHDPPYSGMYLGQNNPDLEKTPYIANFFVHDNIMEDLGAYGMTVKGVHSTSGVCAIYNNVIKRTGLLYTATPGEKRNGIKTHYYYGSTYANVYGNWIEATKGAGLVIGNGAHQVYDNIIVGCGTGNDTAYGHGIRLEENNNTSNVYGNIIIQPTRYGIYHVWGTGTKNIDRNLIGDPGVGYVESDPLLVEGTGDDANWKEADVASFGFNAWTDDGDYSNDDFGFSTPYTRHRGTLRQKPKYNMVGGRFR